MKYFVATISEAALKRTRMMSYVMIGFLPFMMLAFSFVFTFGKNIFIYMLVVSGAVTLSIAALSLFMTHRLMKKMAQSRLVLGPELIRENGEFREVIRYEDIKSLKVIREYNGDVRLIKVKTESRTVVLHSFIEMELVYINIIGRVDEERVKVTDRKVVIDLLNPFIFLAYLILFTAAVLFIIKYFSQFYNYLTLIFPLIFGSFLLFGKPMSNASGKRFRKFELIVGPLLLATGLFTIVMKMFNF